MDDLMARNLTQQTDRVVSSQDLRVSESGMRLPNSPTTNQGSGNSFSMYTTSSHRPNLKPTCLKCPTVSNPYRA